MPMARKSAANSATSTSIQAASDTRIDRTGRDGTCSAPLRGPSLNDRERQFHLLVSAVTDYAIYMLDPNGVVVSWNRGAERIKGYAAEEIVGEHFATFHTFEDRLAGAPELSLRAALEHGHFEAVTQRVRKDGSLFWANVVIRPVYDEARQHIGFAKVTRDVSDHHEMEEQLRHLAHFDPLTKLPNRVSVQAKLDELARRGECVVVLMLDLDGFKDVNDALGHAAGDAILARAAERIRACIAQRGTVGRWGGDEFVVLLSEGDPRTAEAIAADLIEAFRPAFVWEEHQLHVGLSIGIAVRHAGITTEEVIANADLALYQAKAEGDNTYKVFEPRLRQELQSRKELERELREAAHRGEFELFYQPQVSLSDGQIIGAEALLRWRHPRRGLLSPNAFISTLEHSALAHMVGDWAVREACALAARVRSSCSPHFRVAVNLFAAQFRRDHLVPIVSEALRTNDLPPDAIELEITENIILRHEAEMLEPLRELRKLGVGIAFDDYGTGYASLSLLKGYPLSSLKIDQGFVRNIGANRQDKALAKAILYLAGSFGLDVVAEGIELGEQADVLRSIGCSKAQGYLFGRPMAADQLLALIAGEIAKRNERTPAQ
jgi:diguanylate cyclase (GGDEF)-like protein/PAS domain S-box-containing protein